jgi:tetratricopeptide (TPR) repeat protein
MMQIQIEENVQQALSWADVDRLSQPETAREDRQAIVRRLVARAALVSRENTGEKAKETGASPQRPVPPAADPGEAYDAALRRAVEGTRQTHERLMQERQDAGRLWNFLESHPPAHRRILIRNDRRFQTWGLYDCLRERFHHMLEREPHSAVEAAELALAAAQGLSPATYGAASVRDFQGGALIDLATARRIDSDLAGAQTALDQARAILAMGTGDPIEKAGLENARAALLRDLGRPEEAGQAERRAVRLAHRVGGIRERTNHHSLDDFHHDLKRERRASISGFRPRRH